jgi:hypothetical protein
MINKIFLLLLGIILISYSLFFIIVYLNIMNMGYSFFGYLLFICKRIECLLIIPGILLIIYILRKDRNEIYL